MLAHNGSMTAAWLAAAMFVAAAGSAVAQEARQETAAEQPSEQQESESPEQQQAADGASAPETEAEPPYRAECGPDPEEGGTVCYVDRDTYVGWRTFHAVCHTCHAQDAVGSTFAPALLPRMRQIDKERFFDVLENGFTGQTGVMPAWGDNPNVNRYYEELWSYLRARSDGALSPGRPQRLPE